MGKKPSVRKRSPRIQKDAEQSMDDQQFRDRVISTLASLSTSQHILVKDIDEIKEHLRRINGSLADCVTKSECKLNQDSKVIPNIDDIVSQVQERVKPSKIYWVLVGGLLTILSGTMIGLVNYLYASSGT